MDIKFALVTLILPVIMEISGLLMMPHPPKTRNVLFGYRTRRSLLSQETWVSPIITEGHFMYISDFISLPLRF